MNRHRAASQRNQLARIVILALGGALIISALLLTAWGAKAREGSRGWWVKAAVASTRAMPKAIVTAAPAAAIVVTKIADTDGTCQSGSDCSLREAIKVANSQPGDDLITFDASVFHLPRTITLGGTQLPTITTDGLTITGPAARLTISGNSMSRVMHVNSPGTVNLTGLTLTAGRASGFTTLDNAGGGLRVDSGSTVNLTNCVISANVIIKSEGQGRGGGIYNAGTLTVANSTINDNRGPSLFSGSRGYGGGLYNVGTLNLTNSTISGNKATNGGGIYNNGTLKLTHVTITGNTTEDSLPTLDGGGIEQVGGSAEVRNSLIAGNSSLTGPDAHGSFTSLGHNLIGKGTNNNFVNGSGDIVGNNATPIDPGLGPLQDNGGPTPTHALLACSPAIDRDNAPPEPPFNLATDQRGLPRRVNGAADSGAFETQTAALPCGVINTNNTGLGSLRQALVTVATGGTISFNIPTSDPGYNATTGVWTIRLTSGGLSIDRGFTISGPGANRLMVSGNGMSRVIHVNSPGTVNLTGLTLTAGRAGGFTQLDHVGGGLRVDSGSTVNLTNCVVSANVAVNDSNGRGHGVGIYNAGTLTVANSTINDNRPIVFSGGDGEGGGLYNVGTLNLTNSTISGNKASDGGGIYNNGTLKLTHVTITGNNAYGGDRLVRGGIKQVGGSAEVRNSLIAGNSSFTGEDAHGSFTSLGHNLIGIGNTSNFVNDAGCTGLCDRVGSSSQPLDPKLGPLENNGGTTATHALLTGSPAIDGGDNCVTQAEGCLFTPLITDQRGTGFVRARDGNGDGMTVPDIGAFEFQPILVTTTNDENGVCDTSCSLREAIALANAEPGDDIISFAAGLTGTILLTGPLPELSSNVKISGPGAQWLTVRRNTGGAYRIFTVNSGVTATISGLTIANGSDNGDCQGGGGIKNGGTLTVKECAISGNFGCVFGGGLYNDGTLTVNQSTISSNSNPDFTGGGIFNRGTLTVTNSTISGNNSQGGSGIENENGGTVTITHSTISSNTGHNGSGIRNTSGTVQAKNSIFSGNSGSDFNGTLTSQGYNLIQNASGATITGTTAGNQLGVNPLLAPLQNYGGPTATHALLCNSPAINAGDNTNAPATDQRGVARPIGSAVDIGAFEANITLTINPSSLPNGPDGAAYNQTLTATGGATPYNFVAASGSLPTGLTLSTAGVLSGTPTTPGAFTFTVIATDTNGAQGCRTYTVNIVSVNTAPTFTPAAAISRQKGSPASSATVGTVTDAQTAAGSLTVTKITGGTATGITVTSITNTNGTITAQVSAYCSATSGTVRFQVSDGSLTGTGDLQVNVTANTAPTVTYTAVSVNAGNSTSNSPTTATDNGSITGYAVQSQGTYTGTISVNSSGVVSISNAAPVGSHTITIRATDNCGTTADATFTLTVNNNLPTITASAALSRQQGSAGTIETVATVSDGETVSGNLVVTATTIPSGITITSITNANGTIKANVAASCTATVGANTIVLTVTDGNSGTATANLTVNVSANTAPTLTYAASAVNADSATTINPATSPSDNGSVATIALQSQGTYTGTISVNSSGVISISNAAPIGSHTIKIRATDNCGATKDATFTLTVNNNLPSITPGAALTRQQGAAGTVSPIATVSDADTAAGNLVVTATTVPTGITISSISNSNGAITANVTAGCNAAIGSNTVVLTVTDGNGGTNTANLTVNVTANTAPTLVYAAASVNGGASTTVNPTTSPADNGSVSTIAVKSQGTYTGTISVNSSGAVSISNAAPVGSHTIKIRATDNCGATTDASFTLTVNNTAPNITASAALTRLQGDAGTVSTIATVSDAQTPEGSLTVTTITVPAGISVTSIANTNGTIKANVAATCGATAGDHNVVLQVSDGSLTSTATLTVTVTAPAANHLAFGTQPSNAQTGATVSPAVTVKVLNQCNLLMTSATNNITLAIGNNPGSGILSGTLTKAAVGGMATFNNLSINKAGSGYTISATNGGLTGATSSAFNIACPTITLSSLNPPNPVAGTLYSQTLTASGGAPNYSFTVPPGSLPAGLSLASNGTLSGTPTQTGSFTFTVTATDANGCTGSRSYTLQIACFTITLAPSSLPPGTVGAAYTNNLSASGGIGSHTFTVISGSGPTGLTLNSNGAWSGTATAAGTFNFTVEAKDTNQCPGTKAYQVVIGCPNITLTPATLNAGILGANYSQTLTPSGGSGSYTFTITGLPAGLTANAAASNVTLSGAPTQVGSFTVNVTITDISGCTGSQQLTLVITRPLSGDVRFSSDFDGDGKADFAVWRPSTATFWVYTSRGSTLTKQLGVTTDVPVPSDYDGDGQTDCAVWRPATATFIISYSSNGATTTGQWGASSDVPTPGDYDGDGKADLAVWRPSTGAWLILRSSNGAMMSTQWGQAGDVPIPGDYDGDGQTDLAVWRPATATYWIYSPTTNTVLTKPWGNVGDVPVPEDYDGDGKCDIAVWRSSTGAWLIFQSSNGQTPNWQWGVSTDIPVPGDYDGDGKCDIAVWRSSTGTWLIFKSTGGTMTSQWGTAGDLPVR